MILNTFAALDALVSLLRFGLGLLVLGLALAAWRRWQRGGDARTAAEERGDLLALPAGLLIVLNVAAWPLLYLLLQSYVTEWPGVMCVYGVTRIGAGSLGPARFLPPLLAALQRIAPTLVFLSGAWLVLHILNRRTRTAPLTGRCLALLALVGLLAALGAAAELTYLAIPKKEEILTGGCCAEAFDSADRAARFVPASLLDEEERPWLYAAYVTTNVFFITLMLTVERLTSRRLSTLWLLLTAGFAVLTAVINLVFLVEAAAPRLLGLPYHHCPYDLIPAVPESLVALALFAAGACCAGWGAVVGLLGQHGEAAPFAAPLVGRLLRGGALLCLASLVMLSLELALA